MNAQLAAMLGADAAERVCYADIATCLATHVTTADDLLVDAFDRPPQMATLGGRLIAEADPLSARPAD